MAVGNKVGPVELRGRVMRSDDAQALALALFDEAVRLLTTDFTSNPPFFPIGSGTPRGTYPEGYARALIDVLNHLQNPTYTFAGVSLYESATLLVLAHSLGQNRPRQWVRRRRFERL